MSNSINRLIQLNAKADALLQFRRMDDEDESHLGRNIAIGTGVAGAGAAGAMYYRGGQVPRPSAVMTSGDTFGNRMRDVGTRMRVGANQLGQDASRAGTYAKGVGSGMVEGASHYGSLRAGAAQGLGLDRWAALKKVPGRILSNLKNLRYQSNSPLIALNSKLDGLLQFRQRDDESHAGRNIAIGAGGVGAGGLGLAYYRGGKIPRPLATMSGGDTWMNRARDVGTRIRVGGRQLGQDASLIGRTMGETPEVFRHFRRSGSGVGGALSKTARQTLTYLRK